MDAPRIDEYCNGESERIVRLSSPVWKCSRMVSEGAMEVLTTAALHNFLSCVQVTMEEQHAKLLHDESQRELVPIEGRVNNNIKSANSQTTSNSDGPEILRVPRRSAHAQEFCRTILRSCTTSPNCGAQR